MTWDVFISHAGEDTEAVALPLAKLLGDRGVKVWLDAHELELGDSLRGKIDEGLAQSQWGVVILSPSFFHKRWFQAEVDALVSRELSGQRVLLPVWHDLTAAELARYSPLLAARLGVSTSEGLEKVRDAVLSVIGRGGRVAPQATASGAVSPSSTFEDIWFSPDAGPVPGRAEQIVDVSRRRLGPYLVQEQIGRGGSGIVFRALQVHLGKTVALKVLYPLDDRTHAVTQAAERGLRGLASVRHPNVLSPLDFGYLRAGARVSLYIATDLIDGTDVEVWSRNLHDSDRLDRCIAVAMQLSQAVKAAHDCRFVGAFGFEERGVLHGDIKPANVLIERDSERVHLCDFMIPDIQRLLAHTGNGSGFREREGSDFYLDDVTADFGTPGFMSPEQELDGTVSEASDIYSLGMTLSKIFWPSPSFGPRWVVMDGERGDGKRAIEQLIAAMTARSAKDRPRRVQDVLDVLATV
jgi:hypothetical protein